MTVRNSNKDVRLAVIDLLSHFTRTMPIFERLNNYYLQPKELSETAFKFLNDPEGEVRKVTCNSNFRQHENCWCSLDTLGESSLSGGSGNLKISTQSVSASVV